MWLLRSYQEAVPTIQAREALQAVQVAAVGSGNMKKSDRAAAFRRWQRAAGGGRRTGAVKLGMLETAAKFGIPVIIEGKPDD